MFRDAEMFPMNFGSTFVRWPQVLWKTGLCRAYNEARPKWVQVNEEPTHPHNA